MASEHHHLDAASEWIERFAALVPAGGPVLDVACGSGRHARLFAGRGHPVLAVDRDAQALARLTEVAGVAVRVADIEAQSWPFRGQRYAGVIVTNYLHRPLLPMLVRAVAPGGVLLYETFAAGNEKFGRPSNPDFLLRPGELLEAVRGALQVIAYEDVEIASPRAARVQRICAGCAAFAG